MSSAQLPTIVFMFLTCSPLFDAQYANRAASAVRGALKEPAKSKLMAQDQFSYRTAHWTNGAMGPKQPVTALSKAGAPAAA